MRRAAIAIALAAACLAGGCIEVVEDGRQDDGEGAPDVAFSADDRLAYLTVVKAPHGLDLSEFEMRSSTPIHAGRNTQAIADDPLVSTTYVRMDAGPFEAGDFVDFCAVDPGPPATVAIMHTASNALVYETTLQDVPTCGTITQ